MNHKTLSDILPHRQHTAPDARAMVLIFPDRAPLVRTNHQVFQNVQTLASALYLRGVRHGDVVLIALEHGYALPLTFLAALHLGAVPCVAPYFSYSSQWEAHINRINRLARHSEAKLVVTVTAYRADIQTVLHDTTCAVLDISDIDLYSEASTETPVENRLTPTGPAFLQYSSGTTGEPKGIKLTHKAVFASLRAMQQAMQLTASDISIAWAPFYHEMGLLLGLMLPLAIDAEAILISPFHWVNEPDILFRAIHQYKGTVSWMPNFGFDLCTRRITDARMEGIDLGTLRFLGNGSEPVLASTITRFIDRFAPYGFTRDKILTGYGLAENVVLATTTTPGYAPRVDWISTQSMQDERLARPVASDASGASSFVSCGQPIEGHELQIVDDHGKALPDRSIGEVVLRSQTVFSGYHNRPDLTIDALRDGWLYTGDLGYVSEGELYITARKKDVIIVGGRNISSDSIEHLAQQILGSAGARVAAFGLKSETMGTEVIILVCEHRLPLGETGEETFTRDIRRAVAAELDISLTDVLFVPKGWIVKTTSGKLARAANRDKYLREGFGARVQHPVNALTSPPATDPENLTACIVHAFEQILAISPVRPDDDFFILGGDSLHFARMVLMLEEVTGQAINVDQFPETASPRLLAAWLKSTEQANP